MKLNFIFFISVPTATLRSHFTLFSNHAFSFTGKISLVINAEFPIPATDSAEDIAAAKRKRDFDVSYR